MSWVSLVYILSFRLAKATLSQNKQVKKKNIKSKKNKRHSMVAVLLFMALSFFVFFLVPHRRSLGYFSVVTKY